MVFFKFNNYFNNILEIHNLNVGSFKYFYFYSDIFLYFGVIFLIINFGMQYKKQTNKDLLISTNTYGNIILMCLIILVGYSILFKVPFDNFFISIFNNSYYVNMFTYSIKLILIVIAMLLFTYIPSIVYNKYYLKTPEVSLLIFINIVLAFTLISNNQYATLLVFLEGFSLILYILTTIDHSQGGIIAATKYYSFGTLGSILLLWGVAHIYVIIPSLVIKTSNYLYNYIYINNLSEILLNYDFAVTLIIIGFLIKLGAAPLHQWVVDVYTGVHLIITAYFSIFVKFVIFVLMGVLVVNFNNTNIINCFIFFSLLTGSLMTIRQLEIKRFLAYSSINHVGFLLMGDIVSSFVYLLTYVCSSLLFFSILLHLCLNGKELIYFSDLSVIKNYGFWYPLLLIISIVSMAGLPPFSGFFGKFMVWLSLIEDLYLFNDINSYFFLLVSLLLSLISIFYYLRILIYIFANDEYLIRGYITNILVNPVEINHQQIILLFIIFFWLFIHSWVLDISILLWVY